MIRSRKNEKEMKEHEEEQRSKGDLIISDLEQRDLYGKKKKSKKKKKCSLKKKKKKKEEREVKNTTKQGLRLVEAVAIKLPTQSLITPSSSAAAFFFFR